ncbi:hypothetical protein H0486_16580 [Lachnospiraceae bacterium MD1]|uniref:Uncharacterized protein n=1 Tax=Variimorphobacter saccharofermentans TaxID=2755051 RepID=A0A839K4E6_9FIRM|nr:hypothetical protein [Variimorphobacter saccharofermentans]MBB2184496.1 hypothetical protein [Variimorphobacter saccharofermentans]
MEIFENINTIVSLIAGVISIVMFLLSKREKDECVKIKNQINQQIQINKDSSISSNDQFNIKSVKTFDNRKSIR